MWLTVVVALVSQATAAVVTVDCRNVKVALMVAVMEKAHCCWILSLLL